MGEHRVKRAKDRIWGMSSIGRGVEKHVTENHNQREEMALWLLKE